MAGSNDARQVALLKSLETQNRFYALVDPALGWKNADAIPAFPDDVPLGIAYPCLEDGLNDFAVIRTTFETLDLFPDDRELREELMGIIQEARGNLVRRLGELRDRIGSGQALFLGTDLNEFKETVLGMATKGALRKQLDQMMKLEVFESVSAFEADRDLRPPEPTFLYQLRADRSWDTLSGEEPRPFIAACFDDLLAEVQDDAHYAGRYPFDCHIFQKFIAVMFVNYATTDAAFYGTAKGDYGVSADREMQETPLYRAIAEALRDREQSWTAGTRRRDPESAGEFPATVPAADQGVIGPLTALANALLMLRGVDHPRVSEASQVISRAGEELVTCLRALNVVAPMTEDPFSHVPDARAATLAGGPAGRRILVAEDNPVNQDLLRRMLEKRGYTVVVAATGREALEEIERQQFDLVLMDVQMPEMGGFEATLAIRAREKRTGKRTPIVAVTAYAMQGFRDKCLGVGMDDYVSKPVHQRELFAALERRLAPDAAPGPATSPGWVGGGLLDRAAVLDRVDGDIELLQALITQFLADYPRQLAGLAERIARHDTRGVELVAHGLRGAIDNFSAQEASAAALRVEMIARDGDLTRAGEAYTALEQALRRLHPALAALGDEGGGNAT